MPGWLEARQAGSFGPNYTLNEVFTVRATLAIYQIQALKQAKSYHHHTCFTLNSAGDTFSKLLLAESKVSFCGASIDNLQN